MTTLADYRNERLKKLEEIKSLGINPYPSKTSRSIKIKNLLENFAALENKEVSIAGRLVAIRSFGKIAFLKLRDDSGEVQVFMREPEVPSQESSEVTTEDEEARHPWRRAGATPCPERNFGFDLAA